MEEKVLKYLLTSQNYYKRIMSSLEIEFFKEPLFKNIFKLIHAYTVKKNSFCTLETVEVLLEKVKYKPETKEAILEYLQEIKDFKPNVDIDILEEETRNWIKKTAIIDSIMECAEMIHKDEDLDYIPDKIKLALKKGLTKKYGERFSDLDRLERALEDRGEKLPFGLETLNRITNGGAERKTLNVLVASQGGGKTRMLCDLAVQYKRQGYNVLVVTLEISKAKYYQRIDANYAQVDISSYYEDETIEKIKETIKNAPKDEGEIFVEEFPQRTINKNHILNLIDNLKLAHDFEPDVIIIDYLNLLNSVTLGGTTTDTYNLIKFVSEEIRSIAQEFNYCIWTATQFNREGMKNAANPKTEDTSESTALINTIDFYMGLYIDEELSKNNQLKCTVMKTRYADMYAFKTFFLGIEPSQMRHFDLKPDEAIKTAEKELEDKYQTKRRTFDLV